MPKLAVMILSSALALGPGAMAQNIAVLDLAQGKAPGAVPGAAAIAAQAPMEAPRLPLAVTLLSFDRTAYSRGDEVIYNVSIENTSTRPVAIPWSAGPAAPAGVQGYLTLVIAGETSRNQFIAGQALYSDPSRVLAPGEKVRIRAAGPWSVDEATLKRFRKRLPLPTRVWAQFNLYDPAASPPYGRAISANSLTVEWLKK